MALAGKFIVFDGGEGCGKSTQAAMLADRLSLDGRLVKAVHDPGMTRIGGLIREILLNSANTDMKMRCEMLLYMAARAQMMAEIIVPALEHGTTVISDRFVSSTLAYQVGGDDLTSKEIKSVAQIAIKGQWPDLIIILDVPVEQRSARIHPQFVLPFPDAFEPRLDMDRIERRPLAYHEQVRQNYLKQAKSDPSHYIVIDGRRPKEEVHADVYAAVTKLG